MKLFSPRRRKMKPMSIIRSLYRLPPPYSFGVLYINLYFFTVPKNPLAFGILKWPIIH